MHFSKDFFVENETVWLSQAQIGALFGVQKSAISKHLKHIFDSGELRQEAVVSILETTAADGKRYSTSLTDKYLMPTNLCRI